MKSNTSLSPSIVVSNLQHFGAPDDIPHNVINDVFVLLQLCEKAIISPVELISFYNKHVPIGEMFGNYTDPVGDPSKTFGWLINKIPTEIVDWVASLDKDTIATIVFALKFLMWFYSPVSSKALTTYTDLQNVKGDLL